MASAKYRTIAITVGGIASGMCLVFLVALLNLNLTKSPAHHTEPPITSRPIPNNSPSLPPTIPIAPIPADEKAINKPESALLQPYEYGDNIRTSFSQSEISHYADKHTISLDEAQQRLQRKEQLMLAIDNIHRAENDAVAGWGIEDDYAVNGWLWFVGDHQLTERSLAILEHYPEIDVRYYAQYSLKELEQAQEHIVLLPEHNDSITTELPETIRQLIIHTDIDMLENRLVVVVDDQPSDWPHNQDSISLVQSYLSTVISVPYTVVYAH